MSVFDEPKETDEARVEIEENKKNRVVEGFRTVVRAARRACPWSK